MNKVEVLDNNYENLVDIFIDARNKTGTSILAMSIICLEAKVQLKNEKWLGWLKDSRINIKRTQAKKLVAIAQHAKEGQLTDLLNKKGIEETYLLTTISDSSTREEFAEQIIEADFTVKQTKQAISIVKNENKTPHEAIADVKEQKAQPKAPSNPIKKSVSDSEYIVLKEKYEKLLNENKELKEKLLALSNNTCSKQVPTEQVPSEMLLKKPIKSDKAELTLDIERRSIVVQGWELPIPIGVNLTLPIELIKPTAVRNADTQHGVQVES